jgi:SPP1 family predicted phage head-tail adaptor
VIVQSLVKVSDGQGGQDVSWANFKTLWAEIKPVSSKERLFSQQIQMTTTHRLRIRWTDGLLPSMRILFGARVFQIHGVSYDDERKFFVLIDCEENVGT